MSKVNNLEAPVRATLYEIMDPELYISIVDLGLIYGVKVNRGVVDIKMTLTTMGCPLFSVLEADIKGKLLKINGIRQVRIALVFDPPWTIEKMSQAARASLGI